MLQVQMFGSFTIAFERRPVRVDCGASGRRLCAYLLAFPNRSHRRDRLLELFWPETGPEQARAAFSTALWKIQRMFSQEKKSKIILHATPHEIFLNTPDNCIIDAHRFRAAIVDAFSMKSHGLDCLAIDLAASIYRGPFLEEYDEDWVLDQRASFHALYMRALGHLMQWLAQQGRYEDALLIGRRIVASDPMRETSQRAVMLLYVLNGQRGDAIRQFSRCEQALRVECDVDPMPETCALLAKIRSGDVFNELPTLKETLFTPSAEDRLPISAF
jgi:DNA-binding SARP family transcriptional activator